MKINFKNIPISELVSALILIYLLIIFLNPYNFLMTPPFISMLAVCLLIVFAIFAVVLWRENPQDEREALHRMLASRFAFLMGAGVLVIGIIFQSISHRIDPFLIITLSVMILAKIAGILYGKIKY